MVVRADALVVAILVRNQSVRSLKDLPPTQLCKLKRRAWLIVCDPKRRFNSAAMIKRLFSCRVGGRVSSLQVCATNNPTSSL